MKAHIPIAIPPGTRVLRIEREPERVTTSTVLHSNREPAVERKERLRRGSWRIWIHTNDYVNGTYLVLHDDGRVERVTSRADEGDDVVLVKPND